MRKINIPRVVPQGENVAAQNYLAKNSVRTNSGEVTADNDVVNQNSRHKAFFASFQNNPYLICATDVVEEYLNSLEGHSEAVAEGIKNAQKGKKGEKKIRMVQQADFVLDSFFKMGIISNVKKPKVGVVSIALSLLLTEAHRAGYLDALKQLGKYDEEVAEEVKKALKEEATA